MDDLAMSGHELRFDLAGRAAVRVAGGPVAPRHVEPVPPPAPWVIEARCGDAAGWLLGHAPLGGPLRWGRGGAGGEATITVPAGETPQTLFPGPGWGACARMLARDP